MTQYPEPGMLKFLYKIHLHFPNPTIPNNPTNPSSDNVISAPQPAYDPNLRLSKSLQ